MNARCNNCSDVFRVERPAESGAGAAEPQSSGTEDWLAQMESSPGESMAPEPVAADPLPTFDEPAAAEPPLPTFDEPAAVEPPLPSFDEPVDAEPPLPSFDQPAATEVLPPVQQTEEAEPQAFSFGQRDPLEKAQRLARVLVSDMIMYNPERHEQALANGTLKEDFEEEIEKSWKEFVDQVGEEIAEGNDFWTEALNEVLAKGAPIF